MPVHATVNRLYSSGAAPQLTKTAGSGYNTVPGFQCSFIVCRSFRALVVTIMWPPRPVVRTKIRNPAKKCYLCGHRIQTQISYDTKRFTRLILAGMGHPPRRTGALLLRRTANASMGSVDLFIPYAALHVHLGLPVALWMRKARTIICADGLPSRFPMEKSPAAARALLPHQHVGFPAEGAVEPLRTTAHRLFVLLLHTHVGVSVRQCHHILLVYTYFILDIQHIVHRGGVFYKGGEFRCGVAWRPPCSYICSIQLLKSVF